ncbi:MAG: hypothetical protein Q4A82_06065 [Corynebacterium sp.]|nr:hypothetical protein [Corynebacterium sp.]
MLSVVTILVPQALRAWLPEFQMMYFMLTIPMGIISAFIARSVKKWPLIVLALVVDFFPTLIPMIVSIPFVYYQLFMS